QVTCWRASGPQRSRRTAATLGACRPRLAAARGITRWTSIRCRIRTGYLAAVERRHAAPACRDVAAAGILGLESTINRSIDCACNKAVSSAEEYHRSATRTAHL